MAEGADYEREPLYHATLKAFEPSIMKSGLLPGGNLRMFDWSDSKFVYLSNYPDIARDFVDPSVIEPDEEHEEQIFDLMKQGGVILKIDQNKLNRNLLSTDPHFIQDADDGAETYIYSGVIPPSAIIGKEYFSINESKQGVAEGKDFDQCFDQACKMYDRAINKNLKPKLVQVADFQGDGSRADARWLKLPQQVWQHYVVIVGDQVLDPTAKQFGDTMPTQYQVSDLDRLWGKQYQIRPRQGVAEGVNDYLWHGSKTEHDILYPQQANDTGGKEESNKNAVYATPSAKIAIAMGLTTPGSDTGMFPNDPQMVLFSGNIRKGQMVYLHKVPKDLFIKHNSREWYSKPGVEAVKPIEKVEVPVDQWLHLIRQATPKDLELRKKYMKKQGVAEGKSTDTAITLSRLGKFHPGEDTLAEFVPERATAQYALHPDKWESTFYSLTNKDSDKVRYYGPNEIAIPPGTLVGDMAIANKFYRAKTTEEKQLYAKLYRQSVKPYPVDVNQYRMPELLMPRQGVAEAEIDEDSIPVYKSPSQFYAGAGKNLYKLFRNTFPNLPEHVANDIYNQTSPGTNDTIVKAIKQGEDPKNVFLNYYSGSAFNFIKDPGTNLTPEQMKNVLLKGIWKQKILNVNPADFSEQSRNRMVKRNFGINPDEDPTRIQRQQAKAKGDGSNEPVIIIQTSNGFTLWEGFHRTMSILALGKNGQDTLKWDKVKLRAWVVETPSKQGVAENFADGKVKGKSRPGRVKRAGASCDGSVTDLRQRAKNSSGEKAKMYHWCANMKSGRAEARKK